MTIVAEIVRKVLGDGIKTNFEKLLEFAYFSGSINCMT